MRSSSVVTMATILVAARDGSLIKLEISLRSFYIENIRKLGQISSDRRGITWDLRIDMMVSLNRRFSDYSCYVIGISLSFE